MSIPTTPDVPPNYWGDPELPQGDTGLPPTDAFTSVHIQPTQTIAPTAAPQSDQTYDPALLTDDILGRFTADERYSIRAWFPLVWNKPSPYIDPHRVVSTFAEVLVHADGYNKDQLAEQRKDEAADRKAEVESKAEERERVASSRALQADRWLEWQEQCRLRKEWIEGKRLAWKARVDQAKAQRLLWDAHVKESREDWEAAKAVPPPSRPV